MASSRLLRPDFESVQALVISINAHILQFLRDGKARNGLKLRAISKLRNKTHDFFEFSDQSVLLNLYWGIESLEAAIQTNFPERERASRLENSEQMLQVPALLEEQGITAGISNQYLICCSFFYLSAVKKLQGDEWQVALHFLQAFLVSPRLVRTEFAPEFSYSALFRGSKMREMDDDHCDAMRQIVRKYKELLIYYQVMLYGDSNSIKSGHNLPKLNYCEKVHLIDEIEHITAYETEEPTEVSRSDSYMNSIKHLDRIRNNRLHSRELVRNSSIKLLQDLLEEQQSDSQISLNSSYDDSECDSHFEENTDCSDHTRVPRQQFIYQKPRPTTCATSKLKIGTVSLTSQQSIESNILGLFSKRFIDSISDFDVEDEFQSFSQIMKKLQATPKKTRGKLDHSKRNFNQVCSDSGKHSKTEIWGLIDKEISRLCFPEGIGKCDEDYAVNISTIYKMLNNKVGVKYAILKDLIIEQLVAVISTSKEAKVKRASVFTLATIISSDRSVIKDVKNKSLKLSDLAIALKQNIHEAAVLIYLMNPSPTEIKSSQILPTLVEVICSSKGCHTGGPTSLLLTPAAASLMIIEVMVTAFDDVTNDVHLATISSPSVLCRLLEVTGNDNVEELISLATVLVRVMQFDGDCRKYISQFTPMAPFISLLENNIERARLIALEFFTEILRIPRSAAIKLLHQIKKGRNDITNILSICSKSLQPDYQILAANLLLQLLTLDNSSGTSLVEETMQVLLKSVVDEESSATLILSAFILSNLGGTYDWTGESYTVAWLVKKAGLSTLLHQNMITNFDWSDHILQDASMESWCSLMGRSIIAIGNPVFYALKKGLMSKTEKVSKCCLIAIAWLGCEIIRSPTSIRSSACEIILGGIEQFLHPGLELEDRLLACLCIYNYASGKGMQKLIQFSEGVRESLRRLSDVTWIAEELHRVADYLLPNNSRISCVHTQILEVGINGSGGVNALIYYKGLLCSGHSDGSIKVWNVRRKTAMLIWDRKEHRKAVTCFSLFQPGECLLSGSADKTIRVWQMVNRKLECIEVIVSKEPIQQLDACGLVIFAVTNGNGLKVLDGSRKPKTIWKSKTLKCIKVVEGKVYAGCSDSSIQVYSMSNEREQEIKAPAKSWRMNHPPINLLAVYKDWLFSASSTVQSSKFQNWRNHGKPEISVLTSKKEVVQTMSVVEDFIYVVCKSSINNIQIWLRRTQQKVGRISAGSRITSLLTANDIVLCGTETGRIMGWIPL